MAGWRRWLGAALVIAALGFLTATIAREWGEVQRHDWSIRPVELAASVAALVAVFVWGVWVWGRVLARLVPGAVRFRDLLRIWFLSSLARYVPGKIWQFVGAASMAPSAGVASPVLLTSMVIHMGFTLLGAAVVGTLTLAPAAASIRPATAPAVAAMAAASLLLVHPRPLNFALALVPKRLHSDGMRWDGRWRDGLLLLALSIVSWIGYGLAFALFVDAVVDVPAAAILPLTAANALSFLVGYLIFLAPAGLGAREAALAVLLGPVAPAGVAAIVAIAARLWTIAAELLGAAAVLALRPRPGAGPR